LTRTNPDRGDAPLTLAGFACAMLPVGYFRAYADAARRDDIDMCVHAGDYIYEYGMAPYKASGAYVPGRDMGPDKEIVTYADYCGRYASYRADPDLQELHRVKPFLIVWDDHEFTNDAWREGAQNHQPETEGPWAPRRDAAAKAWFDWLPVRPFPRAPRRIHHSLRWGDLAQLTMLDSRLMRDNQPQSWAAFMDGHLDGPRAAFDAEAMRVWRDVIGAQDRTLLGADQERWLAGELRRSARDGAPWQVLLEGSVLGRFNMPAHAERWLAPDASVREQRVRRIQAQIGALGLPFDTPLWSGFPAARARMLDICAREGSNVFAFGGETHTAWAFNLPGGANGAPAAVEIALTAVTSSNGFRTDPDDVSRESDLIAASPELAWCDVHHWGYSAVKFERGAATAEFVGFRSVSAPDAPVAKRSRIVSEASAHGVQPWTNA